MAGASLGFGAIEQFEPKGDVAQAWKNYAARLKQCLIVNRVEDPEMKRAVLLTVIGPKGYEQLRKLVAPDEPEQRQFDTLVATMTRHYTRNESDMVQQFRFFKRRRQKGESVKDFETELRVLAEQAKFSSNVPLDILLKNVFVGGINDVKMQERLLQEPGYVSFSHALRIANGMEASANSIREISSSLQTDPEGEVESEKVNRIKDNVGSQEKCFRCGNRGHEPDKCRFVHLKCFNCGKQDRKSVV